MLPMDLHTHTAAGGHGTTDTIEDLARAAAAKGMTALGISDHGPATPGSCTASFFRGLRLAPKYRFGIRILYGAEANILDEDGRLDLDADVLEGLDYIIASIHPQSFRPSQPVTRETVTRAYINAMSNPHVRILGHPDDPHFPVEAELLAEAAAEYHVIPEVNEASLTPGGCRGDARSNMERLLNVCLERRLPILLSSDSHGRKNVGEAPLAAALTNSMEYPEQLIYNYRNPDIFLLYRQL